jgi:hypothetical protein
MIRENKTGELTVNGTSHAIQVLIDDQAFTVTVRAHESGRLL